MTQKLISNEYRCSSLSIREVQVEVDEARGLGDDPLNILMKLEDDHGYVRDEDLDYLTNGG